MELNAGLVFVLSFLLIASITGLILFGIKIEKIKLLHYLYLKYKLPKYRKNALNSENEYIKHLLNILEMSINTGKYKDNDEFLTLDFKDNPLKCNHTYIVELFYFHRIPKIEIKYVNIYTIEYLNLNSKVYINALIKFNALKQQKEF